MKPTKTKIKEEKENKVVNQIIQDTILTNSKNTRSLNTRQKRAQHNPVGPNSTQQKDNSKRRKGKKTVISTLNKQYLKSYRTTIFFNEKLCIPFSLTYEKRSLQGMEQS